MSGLSVYVIITISLTNFAFSQPPHIVFILADDLGWNDVGFHGSNEVATPNIDALAYSGVIFRSHYSQSLCTPSRAALLTGKYPIRTGTQHNVILEASPWGLPLEEKTLPQYLAPLGYKSHAVGKWHLGFFRKNYTPTYRGFDSHYGLWNGFHDYYTHSTQASFSPFEGYDLRRDMEVDWDSKGIYTTRLLSQEAERIIADHNTSQPLFLYLAHLAVHAGSWERPLQAPQESIRRFNSGKSLERRTYLGMLWELDQSVGRLVTALDDKGILDQTMIIFISDNGAATRGLHKNTGSNFPLRGEKGTPWEGGLRTAAFIWSRNIKRQNVVLDGMIHISDWLPTLYGAAGGDVYDLGAIDGISQWKYINGAEKPPRQEILHNIDDIYRYSALRLGEYKYINGTTLYGFLDDWVGLIEDPNESYNFTAVVTSQVGKRLGLRIEKITPLRTRATISCAASIDEISGRSREISLSGKDEQSESSYEINEEEPIKRNDRVARDVIMRNDVIAKKIRRRLCDPLKEPCLFNIRQDPCETDNLALRFPEKVRVMERRLLELRKGMVPPLNVRVESIADPALYNGTWTYWRDLIPPDLVPPKISII